MEGQTRALKTGSSFLWASSAATDAPDAVSVPHEVTPPGQAVRRCTPYAAYAIVIPFARYTSWTVLRSFTPSSIGR